MRDVQLMEQIAAPLADPVLGVNARLGSTVPLTIMRNYQPSQEGRPDGAALFFFKIFDQRVGQRKISEAQDPTTLVMTRTEVQTMETVFQFGALVPEYPEDDPTLPMAADILKAAAACLQAPDFILSLKAQTAGVQKIGQLRTMPIENDRGQFELNPSFDVTISHIDTFITTIPATVELAVNIKRV